MLTPGLEAVLPALVCPVCAAPLGDDETSLVCASGHRFDLARQGYVSLLTANADTTTADSTAMVLARERFLRAGHYDRLAQAVSDAIPSGPGLCVDLGAGTGFYLARVLDEHPARAGLAIDLAAPAVQRAARAHPRIGAVRANVWGDIPVADAAAAVILSIFSPRNPGEIARMLAADGVLVVLTPTPRHLAELVGTLGLVTVDEQKPQRLETQLAGFRRIGEAAVDYDIRLDHDLVTQLVAMGPSARHLSEKQIEERVSALPQLVDITVSARVGVYVPRV